MSSQRDARASTRPAIKARVLAALEDTASLGRSCAVAGVSTQSVWRWRQYDKVFAAQCAAAMGRAETRRLGRLSGAFRPAKLTADKQEQFLDTLAGTGSVAWAAASIATPGPTLYAMKSRDPAFSRAWDTAFAQGYSQLEAKALHECLHGVAPRRQGDAEPVSERKELAVLGHAQKRVGLARGTTDAEAERDRHEALAAKWVADFRAEVVRLEAKQRAGGR